MKKRVVSAIVMVIIFVPLVIIGKVPYCILGGVLGLLALKEVYSLEKNIPKVMKYISFFIGLFLILYNYRDRDFMQLFDYRIIGMLFLIYTSSVIIYGSLEKYNYKDALWLMLITLLIGTLFNNFIHVRNFGVYHVIYIFLISTCTDTFALFSGKFFGKHKLSPDISPSKTIEGSIGGSLLGTIIPTIFYLLAIDGSINIPLLVVTTFILTIVGQVGDLFFSSIKRYYKVKDFSNLIPGHGGILDRFDSVLFIIFGYLLFIVMI